jgi:4'-phosphopantetheinyl transferase EntD
MASCDEEMQAQDGNASWGLGIDSEAMISVSTEKKLIDEMIVHKEDNEISPLRFPTCVRMLFVSSSIE